MTDPLMVLAPAGRARRAIRRARARASVPAYFTFMLRLYPLLPADSVLVLAVVA